MGKVISVLCPSRERANRAYNYARSVLRTATHPSRIEIMFYIDDDDPQIEDYKRLLPKHLIIGPPISVSNSWNILASDCKGDILLMGNDDLIHKTEGWDVVLEENADTYEDEIYCIFFDDGINSGKHCAFPAVSRKWFNTVGYFTPGIFEFMYNDTFIFDIGKRIERVKYIPEVLVEHNHWTRTKEKDNTTKRHRDNDPGRIPRDKKRYENSERMRQEAALKLKNIMVNN
jgi:hypothetical protein